MRGDGSSLFLHVELGGAFRLSVDVLGDCSVEALGVVADVVDDEGVTPAVLKDAEFLPLFHFCVCNNTMDNETRAAIWGEMVGERVGWGVLTDKRPA